MVDKKRDGAPAGTTEERPRWEGPEEKRPSGYKPARDDPSRNRDAANEHLDDPKRSDLSDAGKTKDKSSTSAISPDSVSKLDRRRALCVWITREPEFLRNSNDGRR